MNTSPHPLALARCYFFTVRLCDPGSDLLVREISLLRDCVRLVRQTDPFAIEHAVILPNRVHMIWTLPPEDGDYGRRWKAIKTGFERNLPQPVKGVAGRSAVWQRRFWECPVRDAAEMAVYAEVIAQAPVEDGLVRRPGLWPYSSLWTARVRQARPALRRAG